MTIDEMIEVLQAQKAGMKLEVRTKTGSDGWDPRSANHLALNFADFDYRIKKEPEYVWRYDYQYTPDGPISHGWYTEDFLAKNGGLYGSNLDGGPYYKGRTKFIIEGGK